MLTYHVGLVCLIPFNTIPQFHSPNTSQESDVLLVKIAECQPKWSLSIIKYTRNATDFGSKFDTTVTENHL